MNTLRLLLVLSLSVPAAGQANIVLDSRGEAVSFWNTYSVGLDQLDEVLSHMEFAFLQNSRSDSDHRALAASIGQDIEKLSLIAQQCTFDEVCYLESAEARVKVSLGAKGWLEVSRAFPVPDAALGKSLTKELRALYRQINSGTLADTFGLERLVAYFRSNVAAARVEAYSFQASYLGHVSRLWGAAP